MRTPRWLRSRRYRSLWSPIFRGPNDRNQNHNPEPTRSRVRRRTKWSPDYNSTCRSSRPRSTHHIEDYLTLTKNGNHHPSRRTLGQTRYHLRNLGKRKNHNSKINPAGRDTARRSPCNNYRRTRTRTAPLSDKKIRSDQNTPNSRATSHTSRINPARSNCRNRRFVCNRGQARRSRSRNSHRRKTSNRSQSNPWVAFLTARGAFPTPPARRRKATRAACGDSARRVCPLRASSWGGPRRTCTPARPPPRRKT